ncbi:hypothetical protein ASF43_11175 [Pseudorhodoferax sp. Leaf267]|nr:hypothetical protein ASF43_11175 [Pseudorhodoferax sp. Leaf267]
MGVVGLLLAVPCSFAQDLDFSVSLDDKPIGQHRFRITGPADARSVTSEAQFDVRLLGLSVYRYQHRATEQWRGHCLAGLTATTDDDGEAGRVQAQARGQALEVSTAAGTQALPGCVMSFAYWSPAIRTQTQLLNAQTGQYERVRIQAMGSGPIDVRGQSTPAERWRITGPQQPIDVWTLPNGDWVGLDSVVRGGRVLRYRLR